MADIEQGSSIMAATRIDRDQRMSFVDYVPPPPKPIPPPAKYKLWILVLVLVYFADWFATEAGIRQDIEVGFRFSFNVSLLTLLAIIVGVLVYGTLDLIILFVKVKIGDTMYGVGPWLKLPWTKWVHEYNNPLVECIAIIVHIFEEGFDLFSASGPVKTAPNEKPKLFESTHEDPEGDIVLRIESHIKPDMVDKYNHWREKFIKMGCHARPGMKMVESSESPDGKIHVTHITFTSIDSLNEYMASPVRERVVRQLQPLLSTPSLVQLQKNRVLPDALTDICTAQGQAVPKLLPKKWKVWTLTTMGLWFVILITNETMPFYYEKWGLLNAHERAFALVRVIVNTFCNVYIMTPFLTMVFGNWLKRQEHEKDTDEPWQTLNDGFQSPWLKAMVAFVFYGGCAITWIVKSNT